MQNVPRWRGWPKAGGGVGGFAGLDL